MDWLVVSAPDRRLLPGGRMSPASWLMAIMTFVMVVVAAAGLALTGGAALLREGVSHRYTIQIADGSAQAAAAAAAAQRVPGVSDVQPVSEQELRATMTRWLGPAAMQEGDGIPLPALIDLNIAAPANHASVETAVQHAVPTARLVAQEARVAPMLGALDALTILALALIALILTATAAAVVLATRSALDAQRATIEVMHGIGATDLQVTWLFQRKIALDALAGSAVGGGSALTVLLILTWQSLGSLGELTGGESLGLNALLVLAAIPVAVALLATLVARWTVLRALRAQL